jgi:hypothetical protein
MPPLGDLVLDHERHDAATVLSAPIPGGDSDLIVSQL